MSDVLATAERTSVGPMLSAPGRVWDDRRQVSERKFRKESLDWDPLYNLYTSVYESRNRWGTSVSIGWSIIQNLVEDSMPALPEPWIMPRRSDANPDVAKMLRDLAKTIHKHCDTKGLMKRARIMCAYSSMPCIWPTFRQVSVPMDANGEQLGADELLDEMGNSRVARYAAKEQIVDLKLKSGWDMRYDPAGREWDLSDHKWIGTIYLKSLQECLDDPHFVNKELLTRFCRAKYGERRSSGENYTGYGQNQYYAGYQEKDIRYVDVELIEIWSRVEHKVITLPVGARFHVGEWDWPEEWKEADIFPPVPVAVNWEGDDRKGERGFYAIPDLRLIRSQLENINRLEGLYLQAATFAVKKYFYPEGIFDDKALTKIQSDVDREMIGIDWKLLKSKLGVAAGVEFNPAQVDMRALIMLLPQESREIALKHQEAINHELELIYETLGQSPADRGGAIALAGSATQAIQIGQGQRKRADAQGEQLADLVDKVTERIFILIKENQTLPIHYLTTGDYANESTWQAFLAEDIEDLDLAYYHHTGSSRPIDRDQYRMEVREVITQTLPLIMQGNLPPEVKFLVRELLSTYDIPGLERAFNDAVPQLVQQGLVFLDQVANGGLDPTDPQKALLFVELFSMLVTALATPADYQQVAAQGQGDQNNVAKKSGPTQQSPVRATRTAGQNRAGSAAAGVIGGVN